MRGEGNRPPRTRDRASLDDESGFLTPPDTISIIAEWENLQEAVSHYAASHELYFERFQTLPLPVFHIDLQTRIVASNVAARQLLNEQNRRARGLNDLVPLNALAALNRLIDRASQTRQPEQGVLVVGEGARLRTARLDIAYLPFADNQPGFICTLGFIRTGIGQADIERDNHARFQHLFHHAHDGLFLADASSGLITQVNAALERLTGLTASAMLQQSPESLFGPQSREASHRYFLSMVQGHGAEPLIAELRGPLGSTLPVEYQLLPFPSTDRLEMWGVLRDLSQYRQTEAQFQLLQEQLQQAQKMESLGRLAGGVAHDMNNDLLAIMGTASALLANTQLPPGVVEGLELILSACRRGRELTRDMLGFASKNTAPFQRFDLNEVLSSVALMMRRSAPPDIRIHRRLSEGLPAIAGDRAQLEHAFLNMCVNAIDAMGRAGELTLSSRYVAEGAKKDTLGRGIGPHIQVDIDDTGVGIDPEILDRVFEPFFTTRPRGEGTGLGLAMVYGTVTRHRGRVWLEARLEGGTRATVLLPVADMNEAEPPLAPQSASRPVVAQLPGLRLPLLIIDDQERVRLSIQQMLASLGFSAELADGGEKGLAMFQARPGAWAGIILDLSMPHMDGIEVLRQIRARDTDIPVLLASGYSDQLQNASLEQLRASAFLYKPFDRDELSAVLRDVFGREAP